MTLARALILLAALLLLATGSCARGDTGPNPPDIRYGEDICDECNMIISDARFAAGYAHETSPGRYETKAFDDIGDMLVHMERVGDDGVVAWYVHDYESEEWIDASAAWFVASDELQTPMGFGIIAYADEGIAQAAAADSGGMVMTWEELLASDVAHGHGP